MAIRKLDLRATPAADYKLALPRATMDIGAAMTAIEPTLKLVREAGPKANEVLTALSAKFDGIAPTSIRVSKAALAAALAALDPQIKSALLVAIERVRAGHAGQISAEVTTEPTPGGRITTRQIPIGRVGLYVPGGRAVYPSSVIMNVVPAQLAGVTSLAVASPPQKDFGGMPHPTVLAACALLGVEEVYAVGGAQAIAMFAYGASGICQPVDLVTGPGNIYVAAAKRALRGLIAIDSEAGPTEIAILADGTANANEIAADLISQAEHDTIAAAVLVTDSAELISQVEQELERRVALTKHHERISTALAGIQSALVLVKDQAQGIDVVNAYAAEHLEVITDSAPAVARKIKNAGAVFIGRFSPVSLGDYAAGSNHVLPTGGCACHSSGLSVRTFLKNMSFIEYDEAAFREIASTIVTLANAEDLPAHGEAITARFEDQA